MNNWSDGSITEDGFKLHYYRTGGDKPPLVINHGAGDDGLCWTHIANELETDYDVILPDARGHGKSSSGRGDYSTSTRVKDLADLIQSLGIKHPLIGGHSMGADTCLHYAAAFPGQISGVFLEDPPIILPGETFDLGRWTIKAENAGRLMAGMMLVFKLAPKFIGIHLARMMFPTYPDDEIIPWVNSKRRVSFNFLNALPGMAFDHGQPFDAFKKVDAPILLFTGDREKMAIVSQAAAQEAVNANPKVEVVHLAGASHDIRRTRFDDYISNLRDFLSRIYPP